MGHDDRDFEAVFAELRETFRRRLPDAAKEMADALDLCEGPTTELSAALDRLRRTAHSLAGQGGTFGFPSISAAAADLEDFIVDLNGRPPAQTDAGLSRLRQMVGSLLQITSRC